MKKQETLWKKLHPECKQAIKNIKKDYPTTFEDLKNQLKNETSWVNIRYGTAVELWMSVTFLFLVMRLENKYYEQIKSKSSRSFY